MRIALFSECYTPVLNGVVIAIQTLQETMRSFGHEVFVFAAGEPQPEDDDHIFRLPALPFPEHPYRFARPFPKLPVDFLSLHVDIIHCQHPFPVGQLGARLAKKHRLPMVYTVHSLYDTMLLFVKSRLVQQVGPPYMRRWMRSFCNRADAVIAPSHYVARSLREIDIVSPIHVVPSGVLPPLLFPEDRHGLRCALGIPEEVPILLYVGRLAPEKRVDLILHAAAHLCKKRLPPPQDSFRVVIVGDGPCRTALEALANQLAISNRTLFVGTQPHERIGAWYAMSDLFVMPSPLETQGLVVIEAMHCGLPCVAVEEGGAGEAIVPEETGFVCPFDAVAFSQVIERLLQNAHLRSRMAQNARAHARRYHPHQTTENVLAVYEEVLAKRRQQ